MDVDAHQGVGLVGGTNGIAITLHRLLRDNQVALPDDPDLIDELVNVKLVETAPSSYRIDHDSSQHDDRVISLALSAARRVMDEDPVIAGGYATGELRPFRVSLMRGRD